MELLREQAWMLGRAMYVLPMQLATVVRSLGIVFLLGSLHPALLLLPLFGLPSIAAEAAAERKARSADEDSAEDLRRSRHFFELSTASGPGKELRIFNLERHILASHRESWQRTYLRQVRAWREGALLSFTGWAFFVVGYGGSVTLIAWRAASGAASPGDVVLALTLAAQVNTNVVATAQISVWMQRTLSVARHLLWLKDQAPDKTTYSCGVALPTEFTDGLTLEHLSFRYPGTRRSVKAPDTTFRIGGEEPPCAS
jgi:ATP-binding cassette, subfamily B, bacterial